MRRTKNISKRIAVAILAAALTMTSASATVLLNSTVVYAITLPDNKDTSGNVKISNGDDMEKNLGKIYENKGTIVENAAQSEDGDTPSVMQNYGTIKTNNGGVGSNNTQNNYIGKIETNNGVVALNNAGIRYWDGQDDGNGIRVNNGEVWTNYDYGYIDNNQGAVHTNRGYINKNAGNDPTITDVGYITKGVHQNSGTINDNTGLVEINYSDGTVTDNSGTVTTNEGTVNSTSGDGAGIIINKGTANDVKTGGIVVLNTGTVELTGSGTVTDNFGSVSSLGSNNAVENQYAGSISGVVSVTNYYGGNLSGDVSVTNNFSDVSTTGAINEYRSVSFVASEHSSASYGNDFTEKTLMKSDGTTGETKYYVNVTEGQNGTGTITIMADSNYTLEGADVDNGQLEGYAFTYSLKKQANGSYKLTINAWNGNSLELSQGMFNLVVKAIEHANDPINPPSPSPEPTPSPEPDPNPVAPFGTIGLYNTTDQTTMKEFTAYEAAIIAEINAMPASGGVVSVPNLAQTGLSASVVGALVTKDDAPITLTYTVDGITYMLVIPAGFNLLTLLNAYGGIDFAKLIAVFGASIVV